jgi:carbamate kinase
VIALGGNAFHRHGEKGTFENQNRQIRNASRHLADLVEDGYRVVITHGNGPQIGDTLLRHDAGQKMYGIPPFPMDVCVAETQGAIGYMIQLALRSELKRRGLDQVVLSTLTRVIVDKNGEEMRRPKKPIGPFYSHYQIQKVRKEHPDYTFAYDKARGGWRRLVLSPNPMRIGIAEQSAIRLLVDSGCIVIACGGGGIPVIEERGWRAIGIEAVVDKDLAGERLATLIRADRLVILTDVDAAYVDYGKPTQRKLGLIRAIDAEGFLKEGQFASGSMGPKILAGIRFVQNGGKSAVIAELTKVMTALSGRTGTTIIPDS